MEISSLLASLHGLPQMVAGLLGAGGLYKLIEKLLDVRTEAAKLSASVEGERTKASDLEIKELRAMLIPLAEKAALAGFLGKENEQLQGKLDEALKRIETLGVELRQSQTVAGGYKVIAEWFDDDAGREFLRGRIEAKRNGEGGVLTARDI